MNLNIKPSTLLIVLCSVAGTLATQQVSALPAVQNASVVQQVRKVSGTVSDAMGPLIGATVKEKGTSNGAVTDLDGCFTLSVRSGATLVFSYIGYDEQELSVGNNATFNVTLKEQGRNLNEVVVIGYGTQRREAVTGSVANVRGDLVREVPGSDISNALQGRIAGVQMMQASSKPGASMQIRIRGTRSLTASNDPLVVLDGVPFAGSINDIDPNNIKSMDILKDASATAIYGSRGANGVIIITTYKGYQDQKPTVTYNGYVGMKTLFHRYPMMNAEAFTELRRYANKYQYGTDEIAWGEAGSVDTDWQKLLFKNGLTTNQDIGVSGGSSHGSYNFGLSYFRDEAVIPTQNFNRYALHAAIDQEIGKYVKVGFSTNANYSITNGGSLGLYNTLSATPITNPYRADGTLKERVNMASDTQWVYAKKSIEGLGDNFKDQTKAYGAYNNFYGEVKIPGVDGLKYRINLGLNYRHSDYGNYVGTGVFSDTPNADSHATSRENTTTNWAIENTLNYDKSWGKHTINAVGLYSAEQTVFKQTYMYGLKVPAGFQFYNIGQAQNVTIDPSQQAYYKSGLVSVMGRLMYNYDNKYMLSVAFRSDASSRLAKGHQWHTYPAVSLGWNMARETFMQDVKWLETLKLRVGYGETSNQSVNPYSTMGTLSTRPYNFGESYAVGTYVSSLPNAALGWEYSKTWNFGVDFTLLKGRLSGTLEYYVQNTEDLLMGVNLPSTTGVNSYMANVGKTRNRGFELSLNGTILNNKEGWTWEAGLNWYTNKNELIELASGATRDESNWWFVGYPINVVYDYEKIGIWQKDEEHIRRIAEPGGNAGMIKIRYNGAYEADGVTPKRAYGEADRQIIKMDPAWEGGFNTRVSYKNWDLSLVASYRHGGKLISTIYGSQGYLNMLSGRRGNIKVDYWTENNPTNDNPKPGGIESSNNPKYGNSLGYFSASYLKVRTITLGYNFNQPWLKACGISKARVYATVQNPFVLFSPYTNKSGMDPETNSYGNENQAVGSFYKSHLLVVGFNTPATRNFLLGVNITF